MCHPMFHSETSCCDSKHRAQASQVLKAKDQIVYKQVDFRTPAEAEGFGWRNTSKVHAKGKMASACTVAFVNAATVCDSNRNRGQGLPPCVQQRVLHCDQEIHFLLRTTAYHLPTLPLTRKRHSGHSTENSYCSSMRVFLSSRT